MKQLPFEFESLDTDSRQGKIEFAKRMFRLGFHEKEIARFLGTNRRGLSALFTGAGLMHPSVWRHYWRRSIALELSNLPPVLAARVAAVKEETYRKWLT